MAQESSLPDQRPDRVVVGAMTGTSCDGLDVAALRITGHGLAAKTELVASASVPLQQLGNRLRRVADQVPASVGTIAELSHELSQLHADTIANLGLPRVDLVAVHGQTIFHRPPVTWQLIEPAIIAQQLQCAVVSDLRSADCALGGQGAPLTPLTDWCWFRDTQEYRVVVNLGGFINATLLPADRDIDRVRAADICACNHVLDELARLVLRQPFDRGGAVAQSGTVSREVMLEYGNCFVTNSVASEFRK